MCFTTCQCLSCMQENGSSFIACTACTIRFVLVYLCFYQSYNGFLGFVWACILHVSLLAIGFFTWHSFYSEFPDDGGSLGFCYLSSISNFIFVTFFYPYFSVVILVENCFFHCWNKTEVEFFYIFKTK